jgi:hypothetical protein
MKCDKCGVTDNGTGDWAHVCGPVKVKKSGMNERIRQLAEQATSNISVDHEGYRGKGYTEQVEYFDKEKFAELIIQECAKSLWTEECHNSDLALEEFERNSAKIKEHFGVEE